MNTEQNNKINSLVDKNDALMGLLVNYGDMLFMLNKHALMIESLPDKEFRDEFITFIQDVMIPINQSMERIIELKEQCSAELDNIIYDKELEKYKKCDVAAKEEKENHDEEISDEDYHRLRWFGRNSR